MQKNGLKPQKLDLTSLLKPQCVPLSQIQSPGRILQEDKGEPGFYSHFQALYEEFQQTLVDEGGNQPNTSEPFLLEEMKDLLKIIKTMLRYYKIELFVEEKGSLTELLDFLKIIVDTIYSYSRDFFVKLELNNIYVYVDEKYSDSKKFSLLYKPNSFIMSTLKSKQDIVRKVQDLVKTCLSKATNDIVSKWEIFSRSSSISSADQKSNGSTSVQNPQSILKSKNNSTQSSTDTIKNLISLKSTDSNIEEGFLYKPKKKMVSPRVLFGGITIVTSPSKFQKGN